MGSDCIHGDDAMMDEFLHLALRLNEEPGLAPPPFGPLGLGLRQGMNLEAHDIDVLVPEHHLGDGWDELITIMQDDGYVLHDLHEHAFRRHGASVAFASPESLAPFAGVDVDAIPVIGRGDIRYRLPELPDYLKTVLGVAAGRLTAGARPSHFHGRRRTAHRTSATRPVCRMPGEPTPASTSSTTELHRSTSCATGPPRPPANGRGRRLGAGHLCRTRARFLRNPTAPSAKNTVRKANSVSRSDQTPPHPSPRSITSRSTSTP